MVSFPPRPRMRSLPSVPCRSSGPRVPTITFVHGVTHSSTGGRAIGVGGWLGTAWAGRAARRSAAALPATTRAGRSVLRNITVSLLGFGSAGLAGLETDVFDERVSDASAWDQNGRREWDGGELDGSWVGQGSVDVPHGPVPPIEGAPRLPVSAGAHQTADQPSVNLFVVRVDGQQTGEQAQS